MGGKTKGKRGVGQPKKYGEEGTVVLTVTVPAGMIAQLDAAVERVRQATGSRCSRSSLVVQLLREGLRILPR
jgi:hypothetical protein